jgi:hypothetical protein
MKKQKKAIITMEEKIAHLEEVLADKIKVLGIYEIIQIQIHLSASFCSVLPIDLRRERER